MGLFLDSQFYSIDLYVYAMPILHSLITVTLQLSFKIEKYEPSNFIIFSKIVLAILGPLHVNMNFKINLSISAKREAGIFTGIALNLQINEGKLISDLLNIPPYKCQMLYFIKQKSYFWLEFSNFLYIIKTKDT